MIGFRKEHDKKLGISKYNYELSNLDSVPLSEPEIGMLISYLEQSDMIFSKTLAIFDEDNYIDPYMIFSDGEWMWPSYLKYYLTKQKGINSEFLFHVKGRGYVTDPLTKQQKREATIFIEKEMLGI
jgi:hypothetical protein